MVRRLVTTLMRRLPFTLRPRPLTQTRHVLVGRADLWQMKRAFQIRFLKQMGLSPDDRLFEIGCGTLRGGLPIIEHLNPGNYIGVDVQQDVLDEARKELVESGLEWKKPELLLAPDLGSLAIAAKFDVIWAFSVLIHMSDPILRDALAFVADHLEDDGVFYANVNIGDGDEGRWRKFPVVTRSIEFYGEAAGAHGLTVTDIGPLRDLGHVSGVPAQDDQHMLRLARTATAAAGGIA